jgi:hypothetical protein
MLIGLQRTHGLVQAQRFVVVATRPPVRRRFEDPSVTDPAGRYRVLDSTTTFAFTDGITRNGSRRRASRFIEESKELAASMIGELDASETIYLVRKALGRVSLSLLCE